MSPIEKFLFYFGALAIPVAFLALGGYRTEQRKPMTFGLLVHLISILALYLASELVSSFGGEGLPLLYLLLPLNYLAYIYYVFVLIFWLLSFGEQ